MRPEWFALTLNLSAFCYYTYQWKEPGKIFYWLGAVLITVGLLKMKG